MAKGVEEVTPRDRLRLTPLKKLLSGSAVVAAGLTLAACGGTRTVTAAETRTITEAAAGGTDIGSVECASGRPVEGVWVDVSMGKSDWANWAAKQGHPERATFSYHVQKLGEYTVHVGCGGSPHDWASETWSEPVPGGRPEAFICHDSTTSSQARVACDPIN